MKKVLFSTTSFDIIDNGPALFSNLLYNYTQKNQVFNVHLLTEDILAPSEKRNRIWHLNLKQNRWNRFFYQFIRIFDYHREATKIQSSFNFDALVYNNAFTGFLSAQLLSKPVVVMVNDDNNMIIKADPLALNKNYLKLKTLRQLEKKAVHKANRVIVNSQYMKDLLIKMYGVPSEKVRILLKGIDLSKYDFKLRKVFKNPIELLFVKADFERGGLYDLTKAIVSLKNFDIKLTVIGPPVSMLEHIELFFKDQGLVSYEIHGPIRPEVVKVFFNRADIFCIPSHKEALGVANMEALASGIPVISTHVGGIPEVLDYGKAGWMVEPGNPKQLAEAIKECIENPELRIQKSEHGYRHVQKFNSDQLIENFLKIVDEVIEEEGQRTKDRRRKTED